MIELDAVLVEVRRERRLRAGGNRAGEEDQQEEGNAGRRS
jgi:hypothetical protein